MFRFAPRSLHVHDPLLIQLNTGGGLKDVEGAAPEGAVSRVVDAMAALRDALEDDSLNEELQLLTKDCKGLDNAKELFKQELCEEVTAQVNHLILSALPSRRSAVSCYVTAS